MDEVYFSIRVCFSFAGWEFHLSIGADDQLALYSEPGRLHDCCFEVLNALASDLRCSVSLTSKGMS